MLMLTRKPGDAIVMTFSRLVDGSAHDGAEKQPDPVVETIRVTIVEIRGKQAKLGIDAPPWVRILRDELGEGGKGR
ncbi:MAG: carbon storage regulator [Candidatus Gracilibacteria bacterium]